MTREHKRGDNVSEIFEKVIDSPNFVPNIHDR